MKLWDQLKTEFRETFWEREEIVLIRQKFAELDPKVQTIIQLSMVGLIALILLGGMGVLVSGSMDRQQQLQDINGMIAYAQKIGAQIDAHRGSTGYEGTQLNASAPLTTLLGQVAAQASIAKGSVNIESGTPTVMHLSKVSIRQLLKIFYVFENQLPGLTVKKISVDEKNDHKGYIWADISVERPAKGP